MHSEPSQASTVELFPVRKRAPSQMQDWVENGLLGKGLKYTVLFPFYKLWEENTQPKNFCDIVFEKANGRGETVSRTSV